MSKKIIIEQSWGGLGDNLQFSTLPEVGAKLGYEVWISNHNFYRNEDIKDLVWGLNPHIKGFTDERGNMPSHINYDPKNNIITDWEIRLFGKAYNDSPKLYYETKIVESVKDKTLIDANAISSPIDFSYIVDNNPHATLLNSKKENMESLFTTDIYNWVDVITSCKRFLCQYSGPSVVMPCYGKRCEVYMSKDNNTYKFKTNKYVKIW